jgi:DNA recombination protein RmuC
MNPQLLAFSAAALVLGFVLAWLLSSARLGARVQRLAAERDLSLAERERLEREAAELRQQASAADAARASADARMDEAQKRIEELSLFFERSRRELTGAYAELSDKALKGAVENLASVVRPQLEQADQKISSNLDENLKPVREMLDRYQSELRRSEQQRLSQAGALEEQIRALAIAAEAARVEAAKVASALSEPKGRGNWGEIALKRCVEIAGMSEYCDFETQVGLRNEDDHGVRPDMIVRLPNGRNIFVDAKVPMSFYQQAVEEPDEIRKAELFALHAKNVRRHVEELSRRRYPTALRNSVEFTILFVGSDHFLSAALAADRSLFDIAAEKRVFLASPLLLVPMLRVVAMNWSAERAEENAEKALEIGKDLFERFVKVFDEIEAVGKSLGGAVNTYNRAIRSIDSRLVPKAVQMLEHVQSQKQVPEFEQIEAAPLESSKMPNVAMRLPIRELQAPLPLLEDEQEEAPILSPST